MPKVIGSLPVSGLFGIHKPSGPTSMAVINDIQKLIHGSRLFVEEDKLKTQNSRRSKKRHQRGGCKVGQGGTLDPLANGVLVVGVGQGTKKLGDFLTCTKEYRATCLLGCETSTYDSEGSRVRVMPWKHVTRTSVEDALARFTGEIKQTPPIFSALKMDGKPLYEYARSGTPLPRPIEERAVTVHSLEVVDWLGSNHEFRWPSQAVSPSEKEAVTKTLRSLDESVSLEDHQEDMGSDDIPTAFELKMTVSGGTYVRSLLHDLAHSVGSAGHVVTLARTRQGRYVLDDSGNEEDLVCLPWNVFEKALSDPGEVDSEGWTDWERQVIDRLELIEGKSGN